ncbi:MAG: peptidase M3, partial [Prevotella sp.]|nr:peptidase M3 [Prevotella sp.]
MNNNTESSIRKNPFFEPYNTLHDTVPFENIRVEDFEEAFLEGIRRDNEQIEKTINNPEKPTFDNTIINSEENKEGYYDLLSWVSTVFFNLMSAETNDDIDALANKIQPILTKHANDVRLNEKLFERIKYVHRHHRRLTPEEKMLLDNCYDGFVRSGALLDEKGKEKLRTLTEEASMLSLQFSQNLLKENKAYSLHITDESKLEGLPDTAKEAAAMTAKEQDKEGWIFTLDFPSYSPFMTYSKERELRKEMYMAKNTICTHDNSENNIEICKRLINLRREIAQLLGFKTYADYVLKNRMAGNARNVYRLLNQLIDAYKPTANKEVGDIERMALSDLKKTQLPEEENCMQPWDFGYYSHKLQLKKYNLDSEMLRPYFELSKVIDGVFGLATRLYGITFKENSNIQVYHPDVKAYEVFDKDGSYLA